MKNLGLSTNEHLISTLFSSINEIPVKSPPLKKTSTEG